MAERISRRLYSETPLDERVQRRTILVDDRPERETPWKLQVMSGNLLKVVSWYDNEWGYSCRTVDLISRVGKL